MGAHVWSREGRTVPFPSGSTRPKNMPLGVRMSECWICWQFCFLSTQRPVVGYHSTRALQSFLVMRRSITAKPKYLWNTQFSYHPSFRPNTLSACTWITAQRHKWCPHWIDVLIQLFILCLRPTTIDDKTLGTWNGIVLIGKCWQTKPQTLRHRTEIRAGNTITLITHRTSLSSCARSPTLLPISLANFSVLYDEKNDHMNAIKVTSISTFIKISNATKWNVWIIVAGQVCTKWNIG